MRNPRADGAKGVPRPWTRDPSAPSLRRGTASSGRPTGPEFASYADKNWITALPFTIVVGDQPRRWFTSRWPENRARPSSNRAAPPPPDAGRPHERGSTEEHAPRRHGDGTRRGDAPPNPAARTGACLTPGPAKTGPSAFAAARGPYARPARPGRPGTGHRPWRDGRPFTVYNGRRRQERSTPCPIRRSRAESKTCQRNSC